MGRRAVAELAGMPDVSSITIASRTHLSAEKARVEVLQGAAGAFSDFGESGGGRRTPSINTAAVDARDREAVVSFMKEHDVSLGALGPFYLFEETMVQAAIEARRHYVSLCDDADAVETALAYDGEAAAAGISVIPGIGWTPGITNLLALRAVAAFEKVRAVHMAWAGSGTKAGGMAVILHAMHIFSGRIPTWSRGERQMVKAGSDREKVEFPDPMGSVTVSLVGHPEPVTWPAYYPDVPEVTLKGGLTEPLLDFLGRTMGRLGLTATHSRRRAWAASLRPLLPLLGRISRPRSDKAGAVVTVEGTAKDGDGRDGHSVRSWAVGTMEDLTSVPLAVAAHRVARGRVARKGVFGPEAPGAFDPEEFLTELAERGLRISAPLAE